MADFYEEPLTMEQFELIREDMHTLRDEIVERLDRINGTVRRHDTEIALLRSTSHPQNSCPVVFEVVKDVQELKQAQATTARVARLALAVGGIIAAVAQVLAQVLLR